MPSAYRMQLKPNQKHIISASAFVYINSAGNLVSAAAATLEWEIADNAYFESGEFIDPVADAWEEKLVTTLEPEPADNRDTYPNTRIVISTEWWVSNEFGRAIQGDLAFVGASIMLILIYMAFQLRVDCTCVGSRIGLAIAGAMTVGMALGAAYGLGSPASFYSPVHSV